jgi:acyl CoA:acetate/3-ketoacid CoA transferase beta subunit
MDAPSVKELMATFIARDIEDGEEVFVGTNLPVIRAGVLLAHLHHGPSMRVMVAHTRTNLYHTPVM